MDLKAKDSEAVTILVTGGAGYIGSVVIDHLRARGERVVALDDLSRGHRDAVDDGVPFYTGAVGDKALVERIVGEQGVTACVHLAGYVSVAESVTDPARYYANNFTQGMVLLKTLASQRVRHLVFSSTAAVYGHPLTNPLTEEHPRRPLSPYGWTKRALEDALMRVDRASEMRSVALRYFNAAGETPRRRERHDPETHLIPLALAAASGAPTSLTVFGRDYPTRDGTAVRDYVHVTDLATAHLHALDYLREGGESTACNLGSGQGFSVTEVLRAVERVTGRGLKVTEGVRRAGDSAVLVADIARARSLLAWRPVRSDIESIVRSAWRG